MVKMKRLLVILFLCTSCNVNQYDSTRSNLIFIYNPWISINFNSNEIRGNFGDKYYIKTLDLNASEQLAIKKSFAHNRIYQIVGEKEYFGSTVVMPPSGLTIELYTDKKLQNKMFVADNYDGRQYTPVDQKDRVIRFNNDVLLILKKNKNLQNVLDVFSKYQSNLWRSHMIRTH